jgi:hypothetical protein
MATRLLRFKIIQHPTTPTMANNPPALPMRAIHLVSDILNGRHVLSKLIPPLLFLADALLCALIIWKVPCKSTTPLAPRDMICRS